MSSIDFATCFVNSSQIVSHSLKSSSPLESTKLTKLSVDPGPLHSSNGSTKRCTPSCKSLLTRRAVLCNAVSLAVATILKPSPSNAYSSPYKPGMKGELSLPDRLYEKAPNEIVTTESGLQYFDLSIGKGDEATVGNTVLVNYTSRLRGLNGIKIASTSDDPTGAPFIFSIGARDVVPGVSEAVNGMRVGGKRRAVLPPDISYSSPDMKPSVKEFFARRRLLSVLETNRDATIVFDLELLKIK